MTAKIPPPPSGTGPAGRHLWRAVLADFELAEHEAVLLREAVRVVEVCADLQAVIDAEGVMATSRLGDLRVHPAVTELRQQRLVLARLIVALRVPLGDQEDQPTAAPSATVARLQRRGIRGVYGGGAA